MYKVFVKFSTRVGKGRGNRPFWYTIVYLSYQAGAGKSRRPPGQENGKGPRKWETARVQKGQPQKGGGKRPGRRKRRAERRQKGRRAQKKPGRGNPVPALCFAFSLLALGRPDGRHGAGIRCFLVSQLLSQICLQLVHGNPHLPPQKFPFLRGPLLYHRGPK